MPQIQLSEFDVIFISYDEPNADENWNDLQSKCPWAKRSHGVYGYDAAHKAAANLSETDRFISIDGDNIIDPEVFNQGFDKNIIDSKKILSFKGQNAVNGLSYGNGGIKCWKTEDVLKMKTHENSKNNSLISQIEFCWALDYFQIDKKFTTVYNNASPYQAFRAGFREGCKMSLDQGNKLSKDEFFDKIYPLNFKRLKTWMTIGADVENGLWCIYGARLGFYMTNMTDWNYINVREFKYFDKLWAEISVDFKGTDKNCSRTNYSYSETKLISEIIRLGKIIEEEYLFAVPLFNAAHSEFIKKLTC